MHIHNKPALLAWKAGCSIGVGLFLLPGRNRNGRGGQLSSCSPWNGHGNPRVFHCGNALRKKGGISIPFCLFTGGYRIVIPKKIEKQFLTTLW